MNLIFGSHEQNICSTTIEESWVHFSTGLPRHLHHLSATNWSPTGKGRNCLNQINEWLQLNVLYIIEHAGDDERQIHFFNFRLEPIIFLSVSQVLYN